MRAWKPYRHSALHHSHVDLGATMMERDGWQLPATYGDEVRELAAIRQSVGLCDVSAGGKLLLQGDGLDATLRESFGAEGVPEIGRVRISQPPGHSGAGPVAVLRMSADEAMLTGAIRAAGVLAELPDSGEGCTHVTDVTSAYSAVRIAGPNGAKVLGSLTELDLGDKAFPDLSCAEVKLAEVYGLLARIDRAGIPSYDLLYGLEYGIYVWEALLHSARQYGGAPVGFQAMDRLVSG